MHYGSQSCYQPIDDLLENASDLDTTPSPNLNVLYGLNSQESELDNRIDTICPNQMNDWNPLELSEWKQPIPPFNELSLPDDKCDIVKIEEFGAEYNFKVEPLKNNGKHFSYSPELGKLYTGLKEDIQFNVSLDPSKFEFGRKLQLRVMLLIEDDPFVAVMCCPNHRQDTSLHIITSIHPKACYVGEANVIGYKTRIACTIPIESNVNGSQIPLKFNCLNSCAAPGAIERRSTFVAFYLECVSTGIVLGMQKCPIKISTSPKRDLKTDLSRKPIAVQTSVLQEIKEERPTKRPLITTSRDSSNKRVKKPCSLEIGKDGMVKVEFTMSYEHAKVALDGSMTALKAHAYNMTDKDKKLVSVIKSLEEAKSQLPQ